MKLSLIFSSLASIVAFAMAYPTEGAIAKRSYVENREEFGSNLFNYNEPYAKNIERSEQSHADGFN
ncbi:hypothetical protein BDR06DRAFT_949439 [Suillus hirtellus]|nr:hypothetical protein BDR06DRAFT_949439 [Suillus hirtellus]